MKFRNKTVFIPIGPSFNDYSIVRSFLKFGSKIMVCSSSKELLNLINFQYPKIKTYLCDPSNQEDMRILLKEIGDQIDVWVNNTGLIQNSLINEGHTRHANRATLKNELIFNYFFNIIKIIGYLKNGTERAIVNVTSYSIRDFSKADINNTEADSVFYSLNNALRSHLLNTKIKVFEMIVPVDIKTNGFNNEIVTSFIEYELN